jgi:glutamate synthase (ferredoxin)
VKVIPNDYKRVLDAERRVLQTGASADQAVMSAFELNSHDQARVGGK